MKDRMLTGYTAIIFVGCFAWLSACEIISSNNDEAAFRVDTLNVSIVRDETPGFPYPRMRHEVYFVGRLNVPGNLSTFSYRSGRIQHSVIYDFNSEYKSPAGTVVRYGLTRWSPRLEPLASTIQYGVFAHSSDGEPFSFISEVEVEHFENGPKPAVNSRQLTGPEEDNSYPIFSQDGNWIYYLHDDNIDSIKRVSVDGSINEAVIEAPEGGLISGFTLSNEGNTLVYVVQENEIFSDVYEVDLITGEQVKNTVERSGLGRGLVALPGERRFICISGATGNERELVLIDMVRSTTETLLQAADFGDIYSASVRPGTGEVAVVVSTGISVIRNVVLLDIEAREQEIFLHNLPGYRISWAPNGEDYVFGRENDAYPLGQNLYISEAGLERRLTFYPGSDGDAAFSPDGRSIAFSAKRRGELQIWLMTL